MDHPDVEIVQRERLTNAYLKVDRYHLRHKRFDGGTTPVVVREVCLRGPAVGVVLYDPILDRVVLVEQFRPGAAAADGPAWMKEIVAGMVGTNETPEDVARREAEEEAGATVSALEYICCYYPSPGVLSEKAYVYCGRVDSTRVAATGGLIEEDEDIRVHVIGYDQALALLDHDQLNNSISIIALSWLARHRDRLRREWLSSTGE